jgi:DNA (cytosine-5)-methyltransferase 1
VKGHYYNENDRFAAAWLRNLMAAGLVPAGEVDDRSIADVDAADLAGFVQCHFFAGIAGWPYALSLAGWPEDRPVWTGSCPCQPFSAAGKRAAAADARHLWPEFRRLIAECNPPTVFGEQAASKDGRLWLAGVRADLEALGYAVGAADLCAAGVGAPHIRQRLWWVGHSEQQGLEGHAGYGSDRRQPGWFYQESTGPASAAGAAGGLADAECDRFDHKCGELGVKASPRKWGHQSVDGGSIDCLDGKARRFEPGAFPLAHGVSGRVGRLRGYGNAVVPQVAAEFIAAAMECRP